MKKPKFYFQGRLFDNEQNFKEWIVEFNTTKVTPHSLHDFLYDFTEQIANNRYIIRKDLMNAELRAVFEKLFEVFIKEVTKEKE